MNSYFAALAQRSGAAVAAARGGRTVAPAGSSAVPDDNATSDGGVMEVDQVVIAAPIASGAGAVPAAVPVTTPIRPGAPAPAAAPPIPASGTAVTPAPAATIATKAFNETVASPRPAAPESGATARATPAIERHEDIIAGAPAAHAPEPATPSASAPPPSPSVSRTQPVRRGDEQGATARRFAATSPTSAHAEPSRAATASAAMPADATAHVSATTQSRRSADVETTVHSSVATPTARIAAARSIDVPMHAVAEPRASTPLHASGRGATAVASAAPVEVRIGAIHVEIRAPTPTAPGTVVAPRPAPSRTQPEPRRLSRYYLRGT